MGRVPDFVIAGVQRSGTTACQKLLAYHPEAGIAHHHAHGEIHYWDSLYWRGKPLDWYLKKHDLPRDVVGEKTPSYAVMPAAMQAMSEALGRQVKIILCTRSPDQRFMSHYMQWCNSYGAVQIERWRQLGEALWRGMFKVHEATCREHFDDVLVINNGQLRRRPKLVSDFLGLKQPCLHMTEAPPLAMYQPPSWVRKFYREYSDISSAAEAEATVLQAVRRMGQLKEGMQPIKSLRTKNKN